MRYYIADCHFFHEKLNYQLDCRGFTDVEASNDYMIRQWNKKVRPRDEVVILGDFSWGNARQTNEVLEQLNGILYLIKGNHDKFGDERGYNASRFVWIRPYAEIHDGGRKVILCHYPILCYNGQYHLNKDGSPKTWMLYGHVHDTQDQRLMETFQEITENSVLTYQNGVSRGIPSNMINCFCMYSDYTPLTLDEWIECDKKRRAARKNILPRGLNRLVIPGRSEFLPSPGTPETDGPFTDEVPDPDPQ